MIKDQLTSSVAGIILSHVRRERGRLTAVSDMCGINRREFTRKGLSGMRMHRFLRIVYTLALLLDYDELCGMAGEVLKCIFWMIDETGRLCDGRVGASWVSQLLKARNPKLLCWYFPLHCLFGMHLLHSSEGRESHEGREGSKGDETICIVPSERTAVILSELFPRYLWLAAMYPANLTEWHLQFLLGRKVVLYPPAGDMGDCWLAWEDIASRCRQRYGMDIEVRDFLSRL